VENKICHNCWNYSPAPVTEKFFEDHESLGCSPYCDFYKDIRSVKPDDTCDNWESKMLKLLGAVKTLYGQ
jgi:hypothetical protein